MTHGFLNGLLVVLFVIGQGINYGQAKFALTEPNWWEINPLVEYIWNHWGTVGLLGWKVLGVVVLVGASFVLAKCTMYILLAGNVIVWAFVVHDVFKGTGWRF